MQIRIWIFCICASLSFSAFTQSLDQKKLDALQITIMDFLGSQDYNTHIERQSEFIFCLLSLDTLGKINSVHLLADGKNQDSTYSFLSRMTPNVFKKWEAKECQGKIIIIPIISLVPGKSSEYIAKIKRAYSITQYLIEKIEIISDTNGLVITSALQYNSPIQKKSF